MKNLYVVIYFGQDPDLASTNECWADYDFSTEEEARSFFMEEPEYYFNSSTSHIVLGGPEGTDLWEVRKNPGFKPGSDDSWRQEQAMQAGMAFGCEGYNDYMGF